jgi:pyridinium-3,5-biscarboxylic acid mononucleotide sulfurtransferase
MTAPLATGVAARLFPPTMRLDPALAQKRSRLESILRGLGRTLVAYSGGVDSSLLLSEAGRVLGQDAVGVIARSASLSDAEYRDAVALAEERRIQLRTLETREIEREGYRANTGDRCYHCKAELFERLEALCREEGFESLAYGAVTDDLGDVRPGMKAAVDFQVHAPLLESGFSKLEVRVLARHVRLRVWDKPQSACLASRIPVGSEVTEVKLNQVERAEAWIREAFGVRVVRVRHEGTRARIEVAPDDVGRMSRGDSLVALERALGSIGFAQVMVDPRGYRRNDPYPVETKEIIANGERE